MLLENLKANKYQKIQINSKKDTIYINCDYEPLFTYNLMDIEIIMDIDYCDIEDKFINIKYINYMKEYFTRVILTVSNKESHFTLKQDFSNLPDIIHKFKKLIKSIDNVPKWNNLSLWSTKRPNYISYSVGVPRGFYMHVKDNFDNFYDYNSYDFEFIEGRFPKFAGKIIYDGKYLMSKKFVIKFLKLPKFNKFSFKLDKKIGTIDLFGYNGPGIIKFRYNVQEGKYDVYLKPEKLEHLLYLKALSDISWVDKNKNEYCEIDILNKIYDV